MSVSSRHVARRVHGVVEAAAHELQLVEVGRRYLAAGRAGIVFEKSKLKILFLKRRSECQEQVILRFHDLNVEAVLYRKIKFR